MKGIVKFIHMKTHKFDDICLCFSETARLALSAISREIFQIGKIIVQILPHLGSVLLVQAIHPM